MRALFLILVATTLSSPAFCDDAPDAPPPAFFDDPSLAASVYFPPALATAGVADTGPALGTVNRTGRRTLACTPTNPCALATPAADFVRPTH